MCTTINVNAEMESFSIVYMQPCTWHFDYIVSHVNLGKKAMSLYPKPIKDDEEIAEEKLSSDDEEDKALTVRKRKRKTMNTGGFADDFQFEDYGDLSQQDHMEGIKHYLKNTVVSTLQEKIDEERSKQNVDKRVGVDNRSPPIPHILGCSWW